MIATCKLSFEYLINALLEFNGKDVMFQMKRIIKYYTLCSLGKLFSEKPMEDKVKAISRFYQEPQ